MFRDAFTIIDHFLRIDPFAAPGKETNRGRTCGSSSFHHPGNIFRGPEDMKEPIIHREAELKTMAERHGQGHLFTWWDQLGEVERNQLLEQVASVDFPLLQSMTETLLGKSEEPAPVDLEPAPIIRVPIGSGSRAARDEARERGEALLSTGLVAPLVVAGGQGTRLGFHGPKGAFPVGPLSGKCLFAFFAEKIMAAQKRYGNTIPWYIMTSPANFQETRSFFSSNGYFGMQQEQIFFFVQGTLPAVDPAGKIFLASRSEISLSPDGHGGTLRALAASGALTDMERKGIREVSYFQVDNVLVKPLDPVFIGCHASAGAEMSSKVLRKSSPEEKVGVIGLKNGKLGVIEYSDLSREDMFAAEPDGELKYWAGSIAMHLFQVGFIRRLQDAQIRLPFHRADKKIPHIDSHGDLIAPEQPNGVKFETFIFDALEYAEHPVTLEVIRGEEFSPVKNARGADSPETAERDLMERFAGWLEQAGAKIPRNPDGSLGVKIEISPLFAADAAELRERLPSPPVLSGDLSLQGP